MILELFQLFSAPENTFFAVCLTVCSCIFLLELIGLLVGFSNDYLDNMLPDALKVDLDGVNASHGFLVTLSSWIYLGRMPFLIWLIVFFGGWGVTGLVLQNLVTDYFGNPFIALIAVPVAFLINLFVVRYVSMVLKRILPTDETYAIDSKELVGLEAEIVIGTAKLNFPAQAKVKDQHGTMHYIMVIPQSDVEYKQGDKVIITEQENNYFLVIDKNEFLKPTNY